jgi:hypothetical protein
VRADDGKIVDDERHLTWYVINYFGGFMTRAEVIARQTFIIEGKIKAGYDAPLLATLKTTDPEALSLMSDGVETFLRRVRDRILLQHRRP